MRSRWFAAVLSCVVAVGALVVPTAAAHPGPVIPVALGMGANLSTSGDYATDVLGDPWDFSNTEDVHPAPGVGCESPPTAAQFPGINCSVTISGGQLSFTGVAGSLVYFMRSWGLELPWGRDGENVPINAEIYPVLTLSNCPGVGFAIKFVNDAGQEGFVPVNSCSGSPSWDMRQASAAWDRQDHHARAVHRFRRHREPRLGAPAPHRRSGRAADRCARGTGADADRRRWQRLRDVERQPVRHGRPRRRARHARHRRRAVRQRAVRRDDRRQRLVRRAAAAHAVLARRVPPLQRRPVPRRAR